MTEEEFVIDSSKVQVLKELVQRIRLLFSINVIFQNTSENCEKQWIKLDSGNEDEQQRAKKYVYSACAEVISEYPLPAAVYNELSKDEEHFELERQSCAVIKFCCHGELRKVIIRGTDLAVAVASSKVEEEIAKEKAADKVRTNSELKRKQEEIKDFKKTSMKSLADTCKENPPRELDPSLKDFAMKLDYTEEQIESVVKKFGPQVTQDKLLHELIRTSAGKKISRSTDQEAAQLQAARYSPPAVIARGAPCVARIKSDPTKIEPQPIVTRGDDLYEPPHLEKGMEDDSDPLRHFVIDGSNVAMQHGGQKVFSCRGILLCVEYFQNRGHREITVFVPRWRMETPQPEYPITDQGILLFLEREKILTWTPSRRVTNGRRIVCYDDRFILELAHKKNGIVVSNDNYKDLLKENGKWKDVIEQRLLMYSFVGNLFMVPDDPLGRHGPLLDDFLRKGTLTHPKICPFLKNCTFGLRCKYYHPERDPNRNNRQTSSRVFSVRNNESEQKSQVIRPKTVVDPVPTKRTVLVADSSMPSYQSQITRGLHSDIVSRGPPNRVIQHANQLSPDEYLKIYPNGPHQQYRQSLPAYRDSHVPLSNSNTTVPYYGYEDSHLGHSGVYFPVNYPDMPRYYPVPAQQWTGYYACPPQVYSELYASNDAKDKVDGECVFAVYSKLREIFPDESHKQVIIDVMDENPIECANNDIHKLLDIVIFRLNQK